jgi:hypothetical protein
MLRPGLEKHDSKLYECRKNPRCLSSLASQHASHKTLLVDEHDTVNHTVGTRGSHDRGLD